MTTNIASVEQLTFMAIVVCFLVPWLFSNIRTLSRKETFFFSTLTSLKNIVNENINLKNKNFLIYLIIIFLFILISNLSGMLPYSITLTSFLIVSFFFSLTTFIGLNIIGTVYNKGGIWKLFLPEGIPTFISVFLISIEIISYIAKVFSLSIRLFANMMSGHSLLKILISFTWTILWLNFSFAYITILPMTVVFITTGLEFVIAFLQAYVYIILTSIYLNDAINLH
jgi:ATP synthase subunit 6